MPAINESDSLAAELTGGGIAADTDGAEVTVVVTVAAAYHRLLLAPEAGAQRVEWTLVDAHEEEVQQGHWPTGATASDSAGRLRRPGPRSALAALRKWLEEAGAVAGAPAVPPFGELIGEESNHWMGIFPLAAEHYARALVEGTAAVGASAEDLARLHPELTAEHNMLRSDGWSDGIEIIRALAHGHVFDQHTEEPCACPHRLVVTCQPLTAYGPSALRALQAGFGGDVHAAARAFLARSLPRRSS
ncbi:hypothetical protein ACFC26_21775 [Kitasatospora purpeofusca]|uniref:hypothetical protein n=1 Tax=Kitasatospora purpeofusca TaxID=67352 RepID=UPI0035DAD233